MATTKPALRRFAAGTTLAVLLVFILQLPDSAFGQSPAPEMGAAASGPSAVQPSDSSDSVRLEIENLRREVQALRTELRALKAALTPTRAEAPQSSPSGEVEARHAANRDAKSGGEGMQPSPTAADSSGPANAGAESRSIEVASLAPVVVVPKGQDEPITEESRAEAPARSGLPKLLNNRVTLGGYGSMRFEANNVSPGQFIPSGSPNGFTFRRFVLTTDARLTPRLRIHSETEFERLLEIEIEKSVRPRNGGLQFQHETEGNSSGEISVEQIWGQYDFAQNHGLRFGVVLPPLGRYNILHDDDYWDLPRRTLVDRDAPVLPVPTAWRELGAGLVGSFDLPRSTKLDYQFYVLNGTVLDFNPELGIATRAGDTTELELESELQLASGAFDGSQGARAVAWRMAFSPSLSGEVALSGYHGRYTPDFLSVREPLNSFGLDWKWRHRGFETEGEFVYTSLGRINRVLDNLAAAALVSSSESEAGDLETEVKIGAKGLTRTRYGFWLDLKYHWRPKFLRSSFLGRSFEDPQLIPIARYERVWLNRRVEEVTFADGLITGLEENDLSQDRISLGVNYRPVGQFGIQIAFEHNQRRKGDRLIFPAVPDRSTNGVVAGMTFAF